MIGSAHKLTQAFEQRLRAVLSTTHRAVLAKHVLELSSFYLQNPGAWTPWQEPFAANAYLSYFLPLNLVRMKAALTEVTRFLPSESYSEIWDFGSGTGATHWALEDDPTIAPRPIYNIEHAPQAIALHRRLIDRAPTRWQASFTTPSRPPKKALGVFSYAFLEMQGHLPDLNAFDHLLIVEPSTRECGRALMEWRGRLLEQGFAPLAPCTHALHCPLLVHSNKDWCHHRIHFAAPEWWLEIESLLPMKNRTLTYSYLLASRTVSDFAWRGSARVIGDTLKENGKTRQMICRGETREFLAWLHKHGPPPEIPHGALLRGLEAAEIKGQEVRPIPDSLSWEV